MLLGDCAWLALALRRSTADGLAWPASLRCAHRHRGHRQSWLQRHGTVLQVLAQHGYTAGLTHATKRMYSQ
jgi:hypothetical protein